MMQYLLSKANKLLVSTWGLFLALSKVTREIHSEFNILLSYIYLAFNKERFVFIHSYFEDRYVGRSAHWSLQNLANNGTSSKWHHYFSSVKDEGNYVANHWSLLVSFHPRPFLLLVVSLMRQTSNGINQVSSQQHQTEKNVTSTKWQYANLPSDTI